MTQETIHQPTIGIVRFTKGQDIDGLLLRLVLHFQENGRTVAGFVQRSDPVGEDGCCGAIYLDDILSEGSLEISQSLGKGARGCRLNPVVLAEATGRILGQLNIRPDLVVLNRFGKGESEGRGFRAVIERAIDLNIPVLTAVRDPYTNDCQQFANGYCEQLPMDFDAVVGWLSVATAQTGVETHTEDSPSHLSN